MEKRIKATDFGSESPPPRIMSSECEYSIQEPGNLNDYLDKKVRRRTGLITRGDFNSNGSRTYVDGYMLEYAGPESPGPLDAVASDFAGIELMKDLIRESGFSHDGVYRQTGSFVPVSLSEPNTTRGYHENYLIPRHIVYSRAFKSLFPTFLASKLWDGQGTLVDSGYVLKQKIWSNGGEPLVGKDRYASLALSAHHKPLAMVRHNDDTVRKPWARLELRCVDGGQAPDARIAAFGATSLVLRLFEHPKILKDASLTPSDSLINPVDSAQCYAEDLSLRRVARTIAGKDVSATSIQEQFLEACENMVQKISVPEDELYALKVWRDIVDRQKLADIENGEFVGLDKLTDNVAFYAYLYKKFPGELWSVNNMRAMRACQIWDRILPAGGATKWWSVFVSSLLTTEMIEERKKTPPETRAARRVAMILKKSRGNMGWASILLKGGGSESFGDAY